MSEDTTQGLPQANNFEGRILAQFAVLERRVMARFDAFDARLDSFDTRLDSFEARLNSFDARLASLEDKVESRLHDTRPIWEAVLARLDKVEGEIKTIRRTLRAFHQDILRVREEHEEMRDDVDGLLGRVEKLESGPTP